MSTILSIETSCDETSIAVVRYSTSTRFQTLSHLTHSQAAMHAQYGGVFPAMARREHQTNIMPLLFQSLRESGLLRARSSAIVLPLTTRKKIHRLLDKDPDIAEKIILLAEQYRIPTISAVAVTYGPGLEMALWTGFNTARALAVIWDCDLVPTNHMEGHIYAALLADSHKTMSKITYPALALLISGGHTELVLIKQEHSYTVLGQTLDDAVGEAYDKSARLLGLPYPGGPLVSQQAELARASYGDTPTDIELPRPMIYTKDCNFSFSGLKTAVRMMVQKQTRISKKFKQKLCLEFENAVSDVLIHKTNRALDNYNIHDVIVSGGVSANTHIRRRFAQLCKEQNITLHLPDASMTGDNALMINLAGYSRWVQKNYPKRITRVRGNLSL